MFLGFLLVLSSQAAPAVPRPDGNSPVPVADGLAEVMLAQRSSNVGPDAAAALAAQATGGRVLRVRPRQRNGRVVYEVKVLAPGGHVRTVRVNGATGEVSR